LSRFGVSGLFVLAAVGVATSASAMAPQRAGRDSVRFFFYNPARTIECRFSFGAVACAGFRRSKLVILNARGAAQTVAVAAGFGKRNPICKKPPGDEPECWFEDGGRGPVLPLGASAVDPDPRIYRCTSRPTAIVCRSLLSGRGFRISDAHVTKIAAKH
jgi:hypothetical protein